MGWCAVLFANWQAACATAHRDHDPVQEDAIRSVPQCPGEKAFEQTGDSDPTSRRNFAEFWRKNSGADLARRLGRHELRIFQILRRGRVHRLRSAALRL